MRGHRCRGNSFTTSSDEDHSPALVRRVVGVGVGEGKGKGEGKREGEGVGGAGEGRGEGEELMKELIRRKVEARRPLVAMETPATPHLFHPVSEGKDILVGC